MLFRDIGGELNIFWDIDARAILLTWNGYGLLWIDVSL